METKLLIVCMSHLSDVECTMGSSLSNKENETRLEFVKWLMMKHRDLNAWIDPDAEYEKFLNKN